MKIKDLKKIDSREEEEEARNSGLADMEDCRDWSYM